MEDHRPAVSVSLTLLLKEAGSARLGESDRHPISPKTPAPQCQPIDRRGNSIRQKEIEQLRPIKKHWHCSSSHHTSHENIHISAASLMRS